MLSALSVIPAAAQSEASRRREPESITTIRLMIDTITSIPHLSGYGFRARRDAAPRNDSA